MEVMVKPEALGRFLRLMLGCEWHPPSPANGDEADWLNEGGALRADERPWTHEVTACES